MTLRIQDPFDPNTKFLLEAILEACQGAIRGAGAFAFASPAGVRLLVEDSTFRTFAESSAFDLVVGVDSITNVAALTTIQSATQKFSTFRAHAFLHNKRGSLFHPKVCWFRTRQGAILLTGSGNLTTGGMRGNWEAFSVSNLNEAEAQALETQWTNWLTHINPQLKALNDPAVIAQAQSNIYVRKIRTITPGIEVSPEEVTLSNDIESEGEIFTPDIADRALIAEIPKASARWNQANFDIHTFTNFFGARPGLWF